MLVKAIARYGLAEHPLVTDDFPKTPDMEGVKKALKLQFPTDRRVAGLSVTERKAVPEFGIEAATVFHFEDWAVLVVYSK